MRNEFQTIENEDGDLMVSAWGEYQIVRAGDIKLMTWGENVRRASVEVAARFYTGQKVHNALATFQSDNGGPWEFEFIQCKNGGNVYPVAFWSTFVQSAQGMSGQGAEVSRAKPVTGRIYWEARYDYEDGARRHFSYRIAPDWATFLTRFAALQAEYPSRKLLYRWWSK